jgi:signal transduction histidine kinase
VSAAGSQRQPAPDRFSGDRERLDRIRRRLADLAAQREWRLVQTGRDLHDNLGQMLTAACLRLGLAAQDAPSAVAEELQQVQSILEETVDQVRQLARGLNQSPVDKIGLRAALQRLAERWRPGFAGSINVHAPDTKSLAIGPARAMLLLAEHLVELGVNNGACTAIRIDVRLEGSPRLEVRLEGVADALANESDEVRWNMNEGICSLAGGEAQIAVDFEGQTSTIGSAVFRAAR